MAAVGCNSPTLPLPPPDAPQVAEVSTDGLSVNLKGAGAFPGALVLIFNDEQSVQAGVIVTANRQGVYEARVPVNLNAEPRNVLELWQRLGKQDSSVIVFYVPLHGAWAGPPGSDAGVEDGSPESEAASFGD
jgi:hypothetical protein